MTSALSPFAGSLLPSAATHHNPQRFMAPATINQQQQAALDDLHRMLPPGSTIWSLHRHSSASGMTHWFDFYTIRDNELLRLTHLVCVACGYTYDPKHEALKTTGGGMDMAFHTIYNLGQTMWPEGTPEPHGTRNSEPDTVGGYAFHHRHL